MVALLTCGWAALVRRDDILEIWLLRYYHWKCDYQSGQWTVGPSTVGVCDIEHHQVSLIN